MIHPSNGAERELLQHFEAGERVYLTASPQRGTLTSAFLAQCIRIFSKRKSLPNDCESLCLRGFQITGRLNLNSLGLEGAPLLGFELVDCDLPDGMSLNYAYLKNLVVRAENCAAVRLGNVSACGVTIIDEFRLVRVRMGDGDGLDFSDSRLKSGVRLVDLSAMPLPSRSISQVSFARAVVGSDLVLEGVQINAGQATKGSRGRSFDGEELQVGGTLRFGCCAHGVPDSSKRCTFVGTVHLRGAKIGGQLLLEATHIVAGVEEPAVTASGLPLQAADPTWALMAEEAVVGGDVFFMDYPGATKLSCDIEGQIDLAGSQIGGELHIFGIFKTTAHRIRAFRAQRVRIGGDLRFGWLPGVSSNSHQCDITGECDFSEGEIGGNVLLNGSQHKINKQFTGHPGLQRRCKQAIDLKGSKVRGDVRLESGLNRRCSVDGLRLTGATVEGRLLLRGVAITGPKVDGTQEKAISANGVTIRGGIFAEPGLAAKPCELDGDIRLRSAAVNGPVIFKGVKMEAGDSGVAFWASNTRFGSDLLFSPADGWVPFIRGEVRLRGVHVQGQLLIQGADIQARKTGVALDCFTAKVDKTFALGSFCPDRLGRSGTARASTVTGLVSLAHLSAQHVTIGATPVAAPGAAEDKLTLTGTILMREMKAEAAVVLANLLIKPASELDPASAKVILNQLKIWGVYRPYVVIYANYAKLGSRLFVRLEENSCGLVSLYGASTGTIGAFSGLAEVKEELSPPTTATATTKPSRWLAWQKAPRSRKAKGSVADSGKLRENWGGPFSALHRGLPLPEPHAKKTILLNIDEFTYNRISDLKETSPTLYREPKHFLYWLLGRPTPEQLGSRYLFLQRLVEDSGSEGQANISAHRQLARVYRDMGQLELAYRYTRERRWLQVRFGKLNVVQKLIDVGYSACFGFGYSPIRALVTVFLLLAGSVIFIRHGMKEPTPGHNTKLCESVFCYPNADHPELSRCHLPGDDWHNEWTEAAKMIIPFTRFENGGGCMLHPKVRLGLRIEFASLQVLSWILFPFAAATLTGVLRESQPGS